jgi:hypothetical protein
MILPLLPVHCAPTTLSDAVSAVYTRARTQAARHLPLCPSWAALTTTESSSAFPVQHLKLASVQYALSGIAWSH